MVLSKTEVLHTLRLLKEDPKVVTFYTLYYSDGTYITSERINNMDIKALSDFIDNNYKYILRIG